MTAPATFYSYPKHSLVYHTNWACYARNYQVKDLPIDYITDVAYAFFNVNADGTVVSGDAWADYQNPFVGKSVNKSIGYNSAACELGNLGQFRDLLVNQKKKFNMHIALGGWTWSKNFSAAVSKSASRSAIVKTLTDVFVMYPKLFTGIVIDWEYLSSDGVNHGNDGNGANKDDTANFIKLVKLIKKQLPGFKISICLGADPKKYTLSDAETVTLVGLLDAFHIMTYDFHGSWDANIARPHANPRHSSLGDFSAEDAIKFFLNTKKIPCDKLWIGVASYSRSFGGCSGYGKKATGNSTDFQFAEEPGTLPYKMLPPKGAVESVDPESKAAYCYDKTKKICHTYDNVESVKDKIKLVNDYSLKGTLMWESAGDDTNAKRSLMRTLYKGFQKSK